MNQQLGAPLLPDMDDPNAYSGLQFFTYQASLPSGTTLAPAGSTTLTFNIDGESDFFWDKSSFYVDIANAAFTESTRPIAALLITITDTQSTQPLMNNPVPVPSVFGIGGLPFVLPIRHIFYSKATVKLQLQNISAGATYTRVDLSFMGIKAFLK